MFAYLFCLHPGKAKPHRFALDVGVFVVGRSSACDLVVRDASISRKHARISVGDQSAHVDDLDSLNGTYLDDSPVKKNRQIRNGQCIRFGVISFQFRAEETNDPEEELGSALDTDPFDPAEESVVEDPPLSPAQNCVFNQLLRGLSEKQIAAALRLSPHTVHNHVRAIFRASGVHSRAELLARFVSRSNRNLPLA
jgi:pSer/pThr/pTyr-binding forkhead associated (FHA) protein